MKYIDLNIFNDSYYGNHCFELKLIFYSQFLRFLWLISDTHQIIPLDSKYKCGNFLINWITIQDPLSTSWDFILFTLNIIKSTSLKVLILWVSRVALIADKLPLAPGIFLFQHLLTLRAARMNPARGLITSQLWVRISYQRRN